MRDFGKVMWGALAAAAFGLASAGAALALTPAGQEAAEKAGHVMFEHRCRSCHADDPALKSYGPTLVGIVGRKAGTIEGFAYSDAMKAAGIVWTEHALRAWIADNKAVLPGTRMRHIGVTDTTEQDFLIQYLKTLK